ncbi:hypothetical protein ANN_18364 [Periplaneta americana]|uniref:Uncharacterized protein n=1 Tax=Periplaneta americana TaxID=6978 RepID=A0ABQ8SNJ4_PERAM|nr:hypothetical protein ANN_18364 [Periplaneta americana]
MLRILLPSTGFEPERPGTQFYRRLSEPRSRSESLATRKNPVSTWDRTPDLPVRSQLKKRVYETLAQRSQQHFVSSDKDNEFVPSRTTTLLSFFRISFTTLYSKRLLITRLLLVLAQYEDSLDGRRFDPRHMKEQKQHRHHSVNVSPFRVYSSNISWRRTEGVGLERLNCGLPEPNSKLIMFVSLYYDAIWQTLNMEENAMCLFCALFPFPLYCVRNLSHLYRKIRRVNCWIKGSYVLVLKSHATNDRMFLTRQIMVVIVIMLKRAHYAYYNGQNKTNLDVHKELEIRIIKDKINHSSAKLCRTAFEDGRQQINKEEERFAEDAPSLLKASLAIAILLLTSWQQLMLLLIVRPTPQVLALLPRLEFSDSQANTGRAILLLLDFVELPRESSFLSEIFLLKSTADFQYLNRSDRFFDSRLDDKSFSTE